MKEADLSLKDAVVQFSFDESGLLKASSSGSFYRKLASGELDDLDVLPANISNLPVDAKVTAMFSPELCALLVSQLKQAVVKDREQRRPSHATGLPPGV